MRGGVYFRVAGSGRVIRKVGVAPEEAMSDSEDFSSEEDEDYLPSGGDPEASERTRVATRGRAVWVREAGTARPPGQGLSGDSQHPGYALRASRDIGTAPLWMGESNAGCWRGGEQKDGMALGCGTLKREGVGLQTICCSPDCLPSCRPAPLLMHGIIDPRFSETSKAGGTSAPRIPCAAKYIKSASFAGQGILGIEVPLALKRPRLRMQGTAGCLPF